MTTRSRLARGLDQRSGADAAWVAAYKYPQPVWLVRELPKGPTGKILRREVRPPADLATRPPGSREAGLHAGRQAGGSARCRATGMTAPDAGAPALRRLARAGLILSARRGIGPFLAVRLKLAPVLALDRVSSAGPRRSQAD
jgi:hypothetical protein